MELLRYTEPPSQHHKAVECSTGSKSSPLSWFRRKSRSERVPRRSVDAAVFGVADVVFGLPVPTVRSTPLVDRVSRVADPVVLHGDVGVAETAPHVDVLTVPALRASLYPTCGALLGQCKPFPPHWGEPPPPQDWTFRVWQAGFGCGFASHGSWIDSNLASDQRFSGGTASSGLQVQLCAALSQLHAQLPPSVPHTGQSRQQRLMLEDLEHTLISQVSLLMTCLAAWRASTSQARTAKVLDKEVRGAQVLMCPDDVQPLVRLPQHRRAARKMPSWLLMPSPDTRLLLRASFAAWYQEAQHMVTVRDLRLKLATERTDLEEATQALQRRDRDARYAKDSAQQRTLQMNRMVGSSLVGMSGFMLAACFRSWQRFHRLQGRGALASESKARIDTVGYLSLVLQSWHRFSFQSRSLRMLDTSISSLMRRWYLDDLTVLLKRSFDGWRHLSRVNTVVKQSQQGLWPSPYRGRPVQVRNRVSPESFAGSSVAAAAARSPDAHWRSSSSLDGRQHLASGADDEQRLMTLAFLLLRLEASEQKRLRGAWEADHRESAVEDRYHTAIEVLEKELLRQESQVAELSRTVSRVAADGPAGAVLTTTGQPLPDSIAVVVPRSLSQWMGASSASPAASLPSSTSGSKRRLMSADPKGASQAVEDMVRRISELAVDGERLKAVVAKETRRSAEAEVSRRRPLVTQLFGGEEAEHHDEVAYLPAHGVSDTPAKVVEELDETINTLLERCSNATADQLEMPSPYDHKFLESRRFGERFPLLQPPLPVAVCPYQYPGAQPVNLSSLPEPQRNCSAQSRWVHLGMLPDQQPSPYQESLAQPHPPATDTHWQPLPPSQPVVSQPQPTVQYPTSYTAAPHHEHEHGPGGHASLPPVPFQPPPCAGVPCQDTHSFYQGHSPAGACPALPPPQQLPTPRLSPASEASYHHNTTSRAVIVEPESGNPAVGVPRFGVEDAPDHVAPTSLQPTRQLSNGLQAPAMLPAPVTAPHPHSAPGSPDSYQDRGAVSPAPVSSSSCTAGYGDAAGGCHPAPLAPIAEALPRSVAPAGTPAAPALAALPPIQHSQSPQPPHSEQPASIASGSAPAPSPAAIPSSVWSPSGVQQAGSESSDFDELPLPPDGSEDEGAGSETSMLNLLL
mmetsp:Transcript_68399/g.164173  ORF Transcript_68399/g.164173 Transcript_68399/m.164173 type:complete len:1136 (-) Transcript_68399:106-3513(-)